MKNLLVKGGTASLKVAAEEQVTAVISLSGPQEVQRQCER